MTPSFGYRGFTVEEIEGGWKLVHLLDKATYQINGVDRDGAMREVDRLVEEWLCSSD